MLVVINHGSTRERRGSNHLRAAGGGQLKCLPLGNVPRILLVIYLRLIRDYCALGLNVFAGPPRILRKN